MQCSFLGALVPARAPAVSLSLSAKLMSVLLETPPLKGFSGSLQPYFRFEASPARRRLVPEVPEVPESLFMPYFLSRSQISSARAWNCQPRAVRAKAVRECHIACSLHASRGAHAPALAWTLGAIAGFWGGAPAPRRNFVFETPAQRFVCLRSKTCPSVPGDNNAGKHRWRARKWDRGDTPKPYWLWRRHMYSAKTARAFFTP